MPVYQYRSYGNVHNPDKLVIFIHGYRSSMDGVLAEATILSALLKNAVIVTPQSNKIRKNNNVREWYNVSEHDKEHKRRNPNTPIDEVIAIYNAAGEQLSVHASEMNGFITEMQSLYGVNDENTYVIGFSQGAMMAIYTSLSRKQKVGGCIALSGIVAGKDCLEKELHSRPDVYMFHGKDDVTVQYKTLNFSLDWLKAHNVNVKAYRIDDMPHIINPSELVQVADIINKSVSLHDK